MLDKGTTVAGYRIDGALGEGGMGIVYRATQLSLNRSVALKILSSDLGDDEGFRERFRREGLLQAAIDHPHIVTVYDTGETEHGLFLAMRMVRGPTLKDMILGRELDPARTLRILTQVAEALDTAHEVGLTHRDIKPQNILIGSRDHAYLADFGLTKAPDEAGRLTATGQFVGTIDYVSPEQIQGEPATSRSDIYALTGVLFECLVGSVPYDKPAEAAVVYAHIAEPPPRPTEHGSELPAAIDDVVAKGMAKDPAERYATAGELATAAAEALGEAVGSAGTPPGPVSGPAAPGLRGNGAPTQPADAPPRSPEELAGGVTAASPVQGAPTTPARVPAGATTPAPVAASEARRTLPVAALAAGLAVLGAVLGFAIGGSGGSKDESADLGSSASAGTLALSFPDGWKRVTQEPKIPGLDFSQPIVLAPPSQAGARVEAGKTAGTGPTLLPKAFLARLKSTPARDDTVKLGQLQAYRYKDLLSEGAAGPVTVFAAPTTDGVATVACMAGPGAAAASFARDCERVAGTLELTSGKPVALGPRDAYGKAVGAALKRLDAAAASGTRRLRAAKTAGAQAAAARTLSSAYSRAAGQVSSAPAGAYESGADAQLVGALRRVSAGYRRAAAAAASGNRSSYAAAGRRIRRGGASLRRALSALRTLGYKVET